MTRRRPERGMPVLSVIPEFFKDPLTRCGSVSRQPAIGDAASARVLLLSVLRIYAAHSRRCGTLF